MSKVSLMRSKARLAIVLRKSPSGTCVLGGRPPAYRRRELILGCCTKRGNLSLRCEGRTSSGEPDKRESTDVEHRGGSIRSSVEVPVMGMERRGRHTRAFSTCQLATG